MSERLLVLVRHGQESSGRSYLRKRDEIQELLIRELFESKTQAE